MTEETAGTPRVDLVTIKALRNVRAKSPYWSVEFEYETWECVTVEFARQLEREVAAMTAERDEERARSTGLEGERIELQAKIGHLEQAHLAVPRDTTCESPPEVD